MAKRRKLNKKVALIGSVIFAFLMLGAILLFLHFSRDPAKFIKDGEAAVKAAREAVDDQARAKEYEKAIYSYSKAAALAKSDTLQVDMLFKLADVYAAKDDWLNVNGCWNRIIQIDPKNIRARLGRLRYFYIIAETGRQAWQWQEIESQASELIKIVEEMDLLMEATTKWESLELQDSDAGVEYLGPFLYLCRGRTLIEMAGLGGVTDPDALLSRAIDDLKKVQELEPTNVEAYSRLARAFITKGSLLASRGDIEGRDESRRRALELLEQAVEASSNDVRARIDVLTIKSAFAQEQGREQLQSLEPEYLSLVKEFNSSAMAFSALSGFYNKLGYKYLDKALAASEKAIELDADNVIYAINACNLYYRKYSIYGQKSAIYKAVEIAEKALTFPDAIDEAGPRRGENRLNSVSLYVFLAHCYIEQVLEPCEVRTKEETRQWLTKAEEAVHEIEKAVGSGEEPFIVGWQGMLELAKGNKNDAVRKLYAAYEQIKATGVEDLPPSLFRRSYAQLCYTLVKTFKGTSEFGAVGEFLGSSIKTGISEMKPEAILDYGDVSLELKDYGAAMAAVNLFESEYWTNERSQALRANIYITARQFNEAEEELAKRQPDDPNTVKLNLALVQAKIEQFQKVIQVKKWQENLGPILSSYSKIKEDIESQTAELESDKSARAELVEKLLLMAPHSVGEDFIVTVCDDYIAEGKTKQAVNLVNRFLEYSPANTKVLVCKQILSEPEPDKISQQRREQLEERVLSSVADSTERAMKLGIFYQEHGNLSKAAGEFKKVVKMETLKKGTGEASDRAEGITDSQRLAADHLLEVVLEQKDWVLAEQVVKAAQLGNLDDCEGHFFAARLAMAKDDNEEALSELEESLNQKPVFSRASLLESKVNVALGNENEALESARRASYLNPYDKAIAEQIAFVLYERNAKLGGKATSDQTIEAEDALRRAVALNIDNPELLSFYADYMFRADPLAALAIRHELQKIDPSVRNAVLLGRMAARMASIDSNVERKEALSAMAATAFEQAKKIDPSDKFMLMNYAEYLRVSGREEEADQMLRGSDDQRLLWAHLIQGGQLGEAKKVLEGLYQNNPKNIDTIRGLLLVAEKESDGEAIKKYSEEIVSIEDSPENRLSQIQGFLNAGLLKEAEFKVQSFKEKFPDDNRILLSEALLRTKQGRLKEALDLVNKTLETSQENAVAWRLRGQINILMANYDQAIIDLRRSKSLLDDPFTRLVLARAYEKATRYEDAITELKATLANPPAPDQVRTLLEQIYRRLGRREELNEFYNDVLEKFPDNIYWHERAADFAIRIGNIVKAEQLYKQAWEKSLENGAGDATALQGYLGTLVAGKKFDRVFEESGKYTEGAFAPVAFEKMAEAKLQLNDKETARKYFLKAINEAGQNEVLVSSILKVMYMMLGAEEVQAYCMETLAENPDSLVANMAMFNVKKIGGDYDGAIDYVDECIRIVGPDSPNRTSFITKKVEILTLAYAKTSDNNYLKKAIVEYESLLDKMPNNPSVLNNLSYMLAEENAQLGKALEYAKHACDIVPDNPNFLDTYSYVLYKNGKLSEAAEFSQSALQLYEQRNIPVSATVYEHLGMIKEKLGSVDEAIAAYEQALIVGEDELQGADKERIELAIRRLR